MVYNGNSTNQDIVSTISDHTGVHKTAEIEAITRAANEADRIIWSWIFDSYEGWQYDDGNQGTLPSAKAHLTSGQNKYTLPEDALVVRKVSCKDEAGNWTDLTAMTDEDMSVAENEFESTDGQPRKYRLRGNVVEIHPAPNYTQVRSLRMHFDRGSVGFSTTDTIKTPGYASEFHGATSTGAGYIIAADRGLRNLVSLKGRWDEYEKAIKSYYVARFHELNPVQKCTSRTDPLTTLH